VDEDGVFEAAATLAVVVVVDTGPRAINIPRDLEVRPGGTVTVPVMIDNAGQVGNGEFRIAFDAARLSVTDVRPGSSLVGFSIEYQRVEAGVIVITLTGATGAATGAADLVEIDFALQRAGNAPLLQVDLQAASISTVNDTPLVLATVPLVGTDATDGQIEVVTGFRWPGTPPPDTGPPGRPPWVLPGVGNRDTTPPEPPQLSTEPIGPNEPYVPDDQIAGRLGSFAYATYRSPHVFGAFGGAASIPGSSPGIVGVSSIFSSLRGHGVAAILPGQSEVTILVEGVQGGYPAGDSFLANSDSLRKFLWLLRLDGLLHLSQ